MSSPDRRAWYKQLSCNTLDILVKAKRPAASPDVVALAAEELRKRECEGNCPCSSCEEEREA